MDILDDLREIDLAAPEKPDSKVKRLIITIMSIFLVVLMLSYIVVSYPISDIIRGQLESNPLQDNKIILQDFTIHLENKTYQQLRTIYHQEQKKEFSVCLLGKKEENKYFITSLYFPKQEGVFNQVHFEPCSSDTLIMLHSHPYKSCLASKTDLETLRKSQEKNQELLMVVMCEPDRFSVYE